MHLVPEMTYAVAGNMEQGITRSVRQWVPEWIQDKGPGKGITYGVTGLIGKRNREAVTFGTVTATIGIRGTHFGALICQNDCGGIPTVSGKAPENGLHLDVAAGAIVVKNAAGEQVINAGQFGFVQNANTVPAIVPPSEGVQVTMPSSISQNKSSGRGVGSSSDNECAVQ